MNYRIKIYCFLLIILCSLEYSAAMAFTPGKGSFASDSPSPADTTITYSLEGLGGEGGEAIAHYTKGRIKTCTIKVFGENGQSRIRYVFSKDRIAVTEQQYTYKGNLESVKGLEDMHLKKTIHYTMNLQGITEAGADEDRSDIFAEFSDAVPLELE